MKFVLRTIFEINSSINMYFASKFTGILTTIVVSAMSAQAFVAVVPHVSVVSPLCVPFHV